jgi:DNA-binding MarR family transcriptional regulator
MVWIMSIKYMNRVWEMESLRSGKLLLMLAIADHANDVGEAWPSQKHLAKKARLDARQVRRVEDSLIDDGLLVIEEKLVEGKRRRVYKLFPKEADILSAVDESADKMSAPKKTKMSAKTRTLRPQYSGHFGQPNADIFAPIQSHARSESPIETTTEPSLNQIISNDHAADSVSKIASLPNGISTEMWANILAEAGSNYVGRLPVIEWLQGSHLRLVDEGEKTERYQVVVRNVAAADWLNNRMSHQFKRAVAASIGRRVDVEIVAEVKDTHPPAEKGLQNE